MPCWACPARSGLRARAARPASTSASRWNRAVLACSPRPVATCRTPSGAPGRAASEHLGRLWQREARGRAAWRAAGRRPGWGCTPTPPGSPGRACRRGLARGRRRPLRAGRPSTAYCAVEGGGGAGQRRYRLLAEMLSSLIAGVMPEPGQAAAEAGREWGRYLPAAGPYRRLDADEAVERLTATWRRSVRPGARGRRERSISSGCGSARSVRWRRITRRWCAHCTLASCRERWPGCGRR